MRIRRSRTISPVPSGSADASAEQLDRMATEHALVQLHNDFPAVADRILTAVFFGYAGRLGSTTAALAAARDRITDACAPA